MSLEVGIVKQFFALSRVLMYIVGSDGYLRRANGAYESSWAGRPRR